MGQYLELARKASMDLRLDRDQSALSHTGDTLGSGYDKNDINDKSNSSVTLESWDDPAIIAKQIEAERLGVYNLLSRELVEPVLKWLTGDELDRLSQSLQELVCLRKGWKPQSWAAHLIFRASLCDKQHRETAELYTQAACLLWRIDIISTE